MSRQRRRPTYSRHDWAYYREKYVIGSNDVTFESIASEPGAPHLTTIKKRAAVENWVGQRAAYRHQTATKTLELASTTEAEVQARHIQIAKALQSKAIQRLQSMDVDALDASELRQYLVAATDIERKVLGIDSVRVRGLPSPRELMSLSDEELQRLAEKLGIGYSR